MENPLLYLFWVGYVSLHYIITYGPVTTLFLVVFLILRFISKAQIRKNIKLAIYNIIVLIFIILQGYFRYYSKGYVLLFGGSSFLKNLWNGMGAYFDYKPYGLIEFSYIPYQIFLIIFLIAIIGIIVSNITKKTINTDNNTIQPSNVNIAPNIISNNISTIYKVLSGVIIFTTLYLYSNVYISQSGIYVPYINKFSLVPINLGKAITLRDYIDQDILLSKGVKEVTYIENINVTIINDGYHIYQNGNILSGVDSSSFSIIDNSQYVKNKDYEEYIQFHEYGLKEQYAQDKNNIYYSTGKLFSQIRINNHVDTIKTIQEIQNNKQRIYYNQNTKEIFGVDGATFDNIGHLNMRDKNCNYFAESDHPNSGRKKLRIVECKNNGTAKKISKTIVNNKYEPSPVEGTHYTISLANQSSTEYTFEVDVIITIDETGLAEQGSTLTHINFGIGYNTKILNGGKPCQHGQDCNQSRSWKYIGNTSQELTQIGQQNIMQHYIYGGKGYLYVSYPNKKIDIKPGTYTIGRYRFINTEPWIPNSNAQLSLQEVNGAGNRLVAITSHPFQNPKDAYTYTTTEPVQSPGITLVHTKNSSYSVPLNTK